MSVKMALRRFALQAAGGFRGREGAEAFARGLLGSFGSVGSGKSSEPGGPLFAHSFAIVADGKKTDKTVSAYWPERRVLVEVVDRDLMLDFAWGELLRACLQMESEPQYVVLTNQRDVRLYDLAKDRSAPRLTIALDELPKYSEAFPFFEVDWKPGTTPRIINVDKVSKEVADLVAKVYRALAAKNPERKEDVICFALQCIIAMFAEDVGLLPKEYFTTLLYRAGEEGGAEEKLTELFTWMSTPIDERPEPNRAIPYFNGGLFTDAISLSLDDTVLRALTKAAEANWSYVDPHIFGSVFQGVMDDAERHASGAHYTAREDIMSVVGPTIVEPWRERIEASNKLADLKAILKGLTTCRVLDPACGSGNFLYVAFRELYRLETEVLVRIYDKFPSATKGRGKIGWASGIRTTNFFGIDVNAFAVELAKTTLNIAKKIAFDQRREEVAAKFEQLSIDVDPSLPLDNLDENIVCADALFTEWPNADAIVGNPPFLGGIKIREELGADYLQRLRAAFPDLRGRADLCALWFQRAHDRLSSGARAGLIGTASIRSGDSAAAAGGYIIKRAGEIVHAVSERDWQGDAAVCVSVINWVKGPYDGERILVVDGVPHRRATIPPNLQLSANTHEAILLGYRSSAITKGVDFSSKAFHVDAATAREIARDPASRAYVRPVANGSEILGGRLHRAPSWVAFALDTSEKELKKAPAAYEYLRGTVHPVVTGLAKKPSYKSWLSNWWMPWRSRRRFFEAARPLDRLIACSQTAARGIFFFLSPGIVPTDKVQLFAYNDDYSFGVIQSSLHWSWTQSIGGRMKQDFRYSSKVWRTFPWPQEPHLEDVVAVAQAGRALRATRDQLMDENDWSLRGSVPCGRGRGSASAQRRSGDPRCCGRSGVRQARRPGGHRVPPRDEPRPRRGRGSRRDDPRPRAAKGGREGSRSQGSALVLDRLHRTAPTARHR